MNATINGINIFWDDIGEGPAVCLIHGFPLNRLMWGPQVEALTAAGYRVIAPDTRGFGESEAPSSSYSMDVYAADLACLLDHLGVEKAVVGGMSMGGYILMRFLELYPEKAAAACFIVTRSVADDEAGKERRLKMAAETMESGANVVADTFSRLLFAEHTELESPALVEEARSWMLANDPRGLAGALSAMAARKDYTPELSRFVLPSLVIGAEQDKALPPELTRLLVEGLPNNCSYMVPQAGHMVNMEQPNAFNACLLGFLDSLPRW